MNIGLKFRDLFSGGGRLGQAILNELDNLLSGIIAHWQVNHNDDGTHADITATGNIEVAGNVTATRVTADAFYGPGIGIEDIPESSIKDESLLARVAGNETIVGNWAFSTLPTLSTLTGYLKATSGAITAQAIPAGGFFVAELGGSRQQSLKHTTWAPAPEHRDVTLSTTKMGSAVTVRVRLKTSSASTSVQPRLYNVTDGTVAGTGSATTNTTWTEQTFPATLANGTKTYRLELLPGNSNNPVYGMGSLEPDDGGVPAEYSGLGLINVRDYGATGDGVTDDAASIQNALDAARTATRGVVYVPPGIYLVGTTLKISSYTHLCGAGREASIIKRKSGAGVHLIENYDRASTGNTGITISALTFDGLRTGTVDIAGRWCVYLSNTTNSVVRDCTIKSADSDGLVFEFTNGGIVANNVCYDNVKPGIYLSCCDHVTVADNVIYDCKASTAYGIAVSCTWHSTVTGNTLWGTPNYGIGLGRDSRWNTISGNVAEGLGTEYEQIPAGYATYLATVRRYNGGTAGDGLSYAAHDNRIVGNTFANTLTADNRNGIRLAYSHRNAITGNHIGEHGRCGIALYKSTDTTISGNSIFNVGKNASVRWAILADGDSGSYCSNTRVLGNHIYDTQGSPTTYGMQVVGNTTPGCVVAHNRIMVSYPLYEDSSTAKLYKWANQLNSNSPIPTIGGDTVNVKDYGATGDGVTDDTTAIAAAITAGAGKIVYFPPGVYKHSGLTISATNTTLRGTAAYGSGSTCQLLYSGSGTAIDVNAQYCTIENLVLYGLTTATGIDATGAHHLTVRNVGLIYASAQGILATDCYWARFERCVFQTHGGVGIKAVSGFNANVVTQCKFWWSANQTWKGIELGTGEYVTSTGSVIENCSFDGGSTGGTCIHLHASCQGMTITGCRAETAGANFLLSDDNAFGITMVGCNIAGSGSTPAPALVTVNGGGFTGLGNYLAEATIGFKSTTGRRMVLEGNEYAANCVTPTSLGSYTPASGLHHVHNGINVTGVQVYNVKGFGAKGDATNDDTTAIQAALDAAKTSGGVVFFPVGTYRVTGALNLTNGGTANSTSITLRGAGMRTTIISAAHTGHAFDCTGRSFLTFEDLTVTGNAVTTPKTAFLFARNSTGNSAGMHHLHRVYTMGSYSVACLYNYASEDMRVTNCTLTNSYNGAKTVLITRSNLSSLTSSFVTIGSGELSNTEFQFNGCGLHNYSASGDADVLYLHGVSSLGFTQGFLQADAGRAYVYIDTSLYSVNVAIRDTMWDGTCKYGVAVDGGTESISFLTLDNILDYGVSGTGARTLWADTSTSITNLHYRNVYGTCAYLEVYTLLYSDLVLKASELLYGKYQVASNRIWMQASGLTLDRQDLSTKNDWFFYDKNQLVPSAVGSFTLSAAATKVVTETWITSSSYIFLTPTNAAAATLMSGSKSLYISSKSAGASFTVATADGTNAAGTETFNYWVVG